MACTAVICPRLVVGGQDVDIQARQEGSWASTEPFLLSMESASQGQVELHDILRFHIRQTFM